MTALIAIAAGLFAGCALQDASQKQYSDFTPLTPITEPVESAPQVSTSPTPLPKIAAEPQDPNTTDEEVRELYQGYHLPAPESQPVPQEPENRHFLSGPVWVNTRSGVFHYPVTRWYGNTEEGKFMSEEDAIIEGDRPAITHLSPADSPRHVCVML
jgi:hypothetical protein